jgi:hypothetical protein
MSQSTMLGKGQALLKVYKNRMHIKVYGKKKYSHFKLSLCSEDQHR